MNATEVIRFKAAFLLLLFVANTLVGVACSLRTIDSSDNEAHKSSLKAVVHIHKDGKRHIHYEAPKHKHSNSATSSNKHTGHEEQGQHGHKKATAKHDHSPKPLHIDPQKNNNCCTDEVQGFQQLDKSIPKSGKVDPAFFTSYISAPSIFISALYFTDVCKDIKRFVRSYHPPIPDIRVAIQSFQI